MQRDELIKQLKEQLALTREQRRCVTPDIAAVKNQIKDFQVSRLSKTHADLLNSPDTKTALSFFLTDIYSSKDMTERDEQLEKFVNKMDSVFSIATLEVVVQAVKLDALTETLDNQLAEHLKLDFNEAEYNEAFIQYTSYKDRISQIDMVQSLGISLASLVKIPFIATTLKVMRFPAKAANLYGLHLFLEQGFNAFKNTKNPKQFIQTLTLREKQLIEKMYEKNKINSH